MLTWFALCIGLCSLALSQTSTYRLLDSTMWPEFVSVFEWFFKSSTQQTSVSVVTNANASIHEDTLYDDVLNDNMVLSAFGMAPQSIFLDPPMLNA